MRKTLLALVAAATLAVTTLATPSPADARCRGCGLAAGLFGGLAAGAIIGSAMANNPPPPRVYYVPEAAYGPDCWVERRRVFIEGIGYRWRPIEVCD